MWSILRMQTPLGEMWAGATPKTLDFLGFADSRWIGRRYQLMQRHQGALTSDLLDPLAQLQEELEAYFSGSMRPFRISLAMQVTPFQIRVYETLQQVAFGETTSYQQLAKEIGHPLAYRAVAQAHRMNPYHVIIPCHRTLYADGRLGGYAAGVDRKRYLLQHEVLWKSK